MAKCKKFNICITYRDLDGECCSITQVMSKASLGTWIYYFTIEQHCQILDVCLIHEL